MTATAQANLSPYTGRPRPNGGQTASVARPQVQAAETPAPAAPVRPMKKPETLLRIINPAARDRWQSQTVRSYTPERVEQILRTALSGDLETQWELFDLMESTWPRLTKNLQDLKGAIKSLDWTIMPWAAKGENPTPEAQRRADILEEVLWAMEPREEYDEADFEGTLDNVMDAWGKGIGVSEIFWELRKTRFGPVIAPRATTWLHARYYGYPNQGIDRLMLNAREVQLSRARTSEESDRLLALPAPIKAEGLVDFPQDKFIVAIAKIKSGHPAGSSLLRVLAWWWSAANFTAEWFLNYAQIFGMPIRWANYDPNANQDTIDLVCEMLECMGSSGWAAFPAGTTMELKEAAKGGTDNPQKAFLDTADTVCDILILRQTLTTDAGDRGTQALGTVHASVRADVIDEAAAWAARVMNRRLIRSFCILNFGDANECPWLMPQRKQVKDSLSMAQRDQVLLQSGLPLPKEWLYERHDVPLPAEGDELVTAPSAGAAPGMDLGSLFGKGGQRAHVVQAKDATDKLVDGVLEDLTGIEGRWLGGVRPYFERLIHAALDNRISDQDFVDALELARRQMPDLFKNLDHDALADSMDRTMSAGVINGAVRGFTRRAGRRAG